MELTFEKIAKIIEGYIELLSFFPYFNNLKLENIKSGDNYIAFIISTTTEVLKLGMPKEIHKEPYSYETHKKITAITIEQNTIITKGEDIETKPE